MGIKQRMGKVGSKGGSARGRELEGSVLECGGDEKQR